MGWRRVPKPCQTRWWRSPPPRGDRPLKAQLLRMPSPPNNSAKSSSSGNQRGKPLKWFMRTKKKTMRRLRMASSPRGRGWRLPHHLLHLHSRRQHHPPRRLHLQLPPHQSKQFLWRLHFLRLRLPSPTSWRTPQAPPRPMYQLEGVLLQTLQPQRLHQAGMKVLTTHLSSSPNPRRRHRAKKHSLNNQLKKVAARTNNKPPRCLHKQTSLLRSRGCGSPSQKTEDDGGGFPLHHIQSCGEFHQEALG